MTLPYYCVCRGKAVRVPYRECTACQITMPLNDRRQDEKTVAERKWEVGLKPTKEQRPCDHGLFSDEHKQQDLFK